MKIDYEIIRSNRKTLCISVKAGMVIVRAPFTMPQNKIEAFVLQKSKWIANKLSDCSADEELLNYKKIYVKGELVPLSFGNCNAITDRGVTVKSLVDVKKLYIDYFSAEFLSLFNDVCQSCGLSAKSVVFRVYKARWGCCDSKGQIVFNYKLLMLPKILWQCVIVHELCHTVFMDHSKKFHALARSIMPNYDSVHKRLKNYSCVCRLY